jgi:UrcA family protein
MLTHQSRFGRAIGLAAVLAAASLLTANASAREAIVLQTVVSYTDLDLSRQADAVKLYGRLKAASDQVCGGYEVRNLKMKRLRDACYHTALSDAVAKVDRPALNALHAANPAGGIASTKPSTTAHAISVE